MNMEIFVKDFSATPCLRVMKCGTKHWYIKLYCVINNQPHIPYQSCYLTSFLSLQQNACWLSGEPSLPKKIKVFMLIVSLLTFFVKDFSATVLEL